MSRALVTRDMCGTCVEHVGHDIVGKSPLGNTSWRPTSDRCLLSDKDELTLNGVTTASIGDIGFVDIGRLKRSLHISCLRSQQFQ